MITQSILDFIFFLESLPINIKNNILTMTLIINLFAIVVYGIYIIRKD